MKFPPSFLDEIKERVPLSDVIGRFVPLKRKGKEFQACCPFHNEKTPSFTVNNEKGFYYCFGCGASGSAFKFLQEKQGYSFVEAVKYIADEAGIPLPKMENTSPEETSFTEKLLQLLEEVTAWFQESLTQNAGSFARHYIEERGLAPKTVAQFRVGYAPSGNLLYKTFTQRGYAPAILEKAGLLIIPPEGNKTPYDRFRNRLMFPIFDVSGRVIAFGGRILDDGQPKYLNSPETPVFDKSRTLYGLNFCKNLLRKGETAKVVEGYMDVIALTQGGFEGAVAPLGTAMTESHFQAIWRYNEQPILCFDGDNAGYKAAERASLRCLKVLKPGCSLNFVHLPKGEDPDTMIQGGRKDLLGNLFKSATPLVDTLWEQLVLSQDIKTPEKQAKIRLNAFQTLADIEDTTLQELYKQEFSKRFYELKFSRKNASRTPKQETSGLRQKFDALHNQYLILFATLLNHPSLLDEVEEDFASLDFQDISLQNLRDEIFFQFHEDPDLDAETLHAHINSCSFKTLLEKILCEDVYIHASFARPDADLNDVQHGWRDVWALLYQKKELQKEIKRTQQQATSSLDKDTWEKFKALKQQLLENTDSNSEKG